MRTLSQMRDSAAVMAEQPGKRMPHYVLVDYSQIGSGLNETGPHLVTLCGVDRLENWSSLDIEAKKIHKKQWIDCLIADIDGQFPGLADAVEHREMATAETMRHYLNTPAALSMASHPKERSGRQSGRGRALPSTGSGSPPRILRVAVSPARCSAARRRQARRCEKGAS
jgi:hypothetical protein